MLFYSDFLLFEISSLRYCSSLDSTKPFDSMRLHRLKMGPQMSPSLRCASFHVIPHLLEFGMTSPLYTTKEGLKEAKAFDLEAVVTLGSVCVLHCCGDMW